MGHLSVYPLRSAWLSPDIRHSKRNWPIHSFSLQKISPRHRVDAELFYLSRIARETHPSDAARNVAHPRWAELCECESCLKCKNIASRLVTNYSLRLLHSLPLHFIWCSAWFTGNQFRHEDSGR